MFLGHFAVGFAAKSAAPRTSLGSLFLAAQFIDLLWPTFLLLGLERVRIEPGATKVTPLDFEFYPFSHSLLAVLIWAAFFGGTYLFFRKYTRGALILGLAVVSHWFLDAIVHRPDLQLFPGSAQRIGLTAWNSLFATVLIEIGFFVGGLWMYRRKTRASDAIGRWALIALCVFLLLIYFANLFGPPPPNVSGLIWVGQAQWILIAWGFWIDRHRVPHLEPSINTSSNR